VSPSYAGTSPAPDKTSNEPGPWSVEVLQPGAKGGRTRDRAGGEGCNVLNQGFIQETNYLP